jgi:hypothetical protein
MRPLVQALFIFLVVLSLCRGSVAQIPDMSAGLFHEAKGNHTKLKLPRNLHFEPITLQELVGIGGASDDLGVWTEAALLNSIPQFPEPIVVRTVSTLWQLKIGQLNKGNGTDPVAIDVGYEMVASNGSQDALSNVDHPGEEISVDLVPTEPISFIRGNNQLIEAGASFHLKLGSARAAGAYRGSLTVTVHYY